MFERLLALFVPPHQLRLVVLELLLGGQVSYFELTARIGVAADGCVTQILVDEAEQVQGFEVGQTEHAVAPELVEEGAPEFVELGLTLCMSINGYS